MRLAKGDQIYIERNADACQSGWWTWNGKRWTHPLESPAAERFSLYAPRYFGRYVARFNDSVRDGLCTYDVMFGWECIAEQLIAEGAMKV